MMQVLVMDDVWFGDPRVNVLTFDPSAVPTLPRDLPAGALVDPQTCVSAIAVWQALTGRYRRSIVDVEYTAVQARIVRWHPGPMDVARPYWWQDESQVIARLNKGE